MLRTILQFLTATFVLAALALAIGSFAPLHLSDLIRFEMRLVAFVCLALGYVAFEARVFVKGR